MHLISGALYLDGRTAQASELESMLGAMQPKSLATRRTVHVEGPVMLGRLSIRESDAPQPLPRAAGGIVMAADCRLDNERGGAAPEDAQLLAALGCLDGSQPARALGDYAAAVWDPTRRQLTVARDALGIRPLFYVYRPGTLFAFASRPAALLAAAFAAREFDHGYIARWLLLDVQDSQQSLFKEIRRVRPGTSLLVTPGGLQVREDWKLAETLLDTGPADPQEAACELRRLLTQAVTCRLPRQGPVAAHLSGGLDSSSITLLAAEIAGDARRVHCYSMLPSQAARDDTATEWPFVNAVLQRQPGLAWSPVYPAEDMTFIGPQMDTDQIVPVGHGWPDARILADAAAQGAPHIMSGWGGDEGVSFNGRGVLAEALWQGRWRYLLFEARQLAAQQHVGMPRVMLSELAPHLLSDAWLGRLRRIARRPAIAKTRWQQTAGLLLNPEVLALAAESSDSAISGGPLRQALLRSTHIADRTEYWNLNAAHHGIAVVFPLLDRRIVEFVFSLPCTMFLRGGRRRWLLRTAMSDLLPQLLRDRTSKNRPIDDTHRIVAAGAAQARTWMMQLRQDSRVTACLNVPAIEEHLARLATAEAAATAAVPGLSRALRLAAFLEQQG